MSISKKTLSIIFLLIVIVASLLFSSIFLQKSIEGMEINDEEEEDILLNNNSAPSPSSSSPGSNETTTEGFQVKLPKTSVNKKDTMTVLESNINSNRFNPVNVFKHVFGMSKDETFSLKKL